MDVDFIEQAIDSMYGAITKLEATEPINSNEINKLRTFIFDLHKQLEKEVGGLNV